MSFVNTPTTGFTVRVDSVSLNHREEICRVQFSIYDLQDALFSAGEKIVRGFKNQQWDIVDQFGVLSASELDSAPIDWCAYVDPSSEDEALRPFRGRIVKKTSSGLEDVRISDCLVTRDMLTVYKIGSGGLFVEVEDAPEKKYEQFFSISAMNASGTNVIRQAYLFLKTFPEFENAQEG
jgi:hypothetical protein